MLRIESESVLSLSEVESHLRENASGILEDLNVNDVDFVRLGNPTDTSWDPAAIGYRVLRNATPHNSVDFWMVRTRDGRALLALTPEGSTYSTMAMSFDENATEFVEAKEAYVEKLRNGEITDDLISKGRAFAELDWAKLYHAALCRTFIDGHIPARWRQMPHVSNF